MFISKQRVIAVIIQTIAKNSEFIAYLKGDKQKK